MFLVFLADFGHDYRPKLAYRVGWARLKSMASIRQCEWSKC